MMYNTVDTPLPENSAGNDEDDEDDEEDEEDEEVNAFKQLAVKPWQDDRFDR